MTKKESIAYIIKENNKIYAQLCATKREIYNLLSEIDIETALCGSILYHQERFQLDKTSTLIAKLIVARERQYILQDMYRDNLRCIRRLRADEKPKENK